MIQSFFFLCVIKYFLFERNYYEKNIFLGSNLPKIPIFKSSQLSQFLSNQAKILHGNVVWGAQVFMFFEIFRKIYIWGEIGEKLIYCGGHLEISKDHNSISFCFINIIFCINVPNNDIKFFCSLCYHIFCVWKNLL